MKCRVARHQNGDLARKHLDWLNRCKVNGFFFMFVCMCVCLLTKWTHLKSMIKRSVSPWRKKKNQPRCKKMIISNVRVKTKQRNERPNGNKFCCVILVAPLILFAALASVLHTSKCVIRFYFVFFALTLQLTEPQLQSIVIVDYLCAAHRHLFSHVYQQKLLTRIAFIYLDTNQKSNEFLCRWWMCFCLKTNKPIEMRFYTNSATNTEQKASNSNDHYDG